MMKRKKKVFKHSLENEWGEWQRAHQSLDTEIQWRVKRGAAYRLLNDMKSMGCEGEGIGSSDVNHSCFNMWKSNDKKVRAYMHEGLNWYGEEINERMEAVGL